MDSRRLLRRIYRTTAEIPDIRDSSLQRGAVSTETTANHAEQARQSELIAYECASCNLLLPDPDCIHPCVELGDQEDEGFNEITEDFWEWIENLIQLPASQVRIIAN